MEKSIMIKVEKAKWEKFKKLVRSKGYFVSFVIDKLIDKYLKENGGIK